ncbi:MAG: hemolysin family protein [Fusobacteria bacterium]|nr:hemolysin family protein [Fusobacteriota bacterium]
MMIILFIIILVILIVFSGFFSASETSLTSFKYTDYIEESRHRKDKKIIYLGEWFKNPSKFLTGTLVGNNIINTLATAFFTVFITIVNEKKHLSGFENIFITTVVMSFLILLFSEITPKVLAKKHSKKVVFKIIVPTYWCIVILTPLIWVFVEATKILLFVFGVRLDQKEVLVTEKEIRSMVSIGEEEGIIEKVEKEMINSIFEFGDTTVKEVLISRSQVFALDIEEKIESSINNLNRNGYSRVPVYGDNLDNILGILHVKDLWKIANCGEDDLPTKELISILHNPYFIPENMNLMVLLNEFKKRRLHFAVVIDEYGTTIGIVTLEDLIEEIIGEIEDEHDSTIEKIKQISNVKFIIDPLVEIDVLNKAVGLNIPESTEYTTLAGYLLSKIQKIPDKNEEFVIDKLRIKILSLRSHRIFKVRLIKT